MANTKYTRILRNWYCFVVLIAIYAGLPNSAIGGESTEVDLTASPLAGKAMRYTYVLNYSVNHRADHQAIAIDEFLELSFDERECTYLGLGGRFKGWLETIACGQKEIAPGIYFVSWLEPSQMVVSMVINTHTMTLNTSFFEWTPGGLVNLAFMQAEIEIFGPSEEIKALRSEELKKHLEKSKKK